MICFALKSKKWERGCWSFKIVGMISMSEQSSSVDYSAYINDKSTTKRMIHFLIRIQPFHSYRLMNGLWNGALKTMQNMRKTPLIHCQQGFVVNQTNLLLGFHTFNFLDVQIIRKLIGKYFNYLLCLSLSTPSCGLWFRISNEKFYLVETTGKHSKEIVPVAREFHSNSLSS